VVEKIEQKEGFAQICGFKPYFEKNALVGTITTEWIGRILIDRYGRKPL
jgi:hypothetical protein